MEKPYFLSNNMEENQKNSDVENKSSVNDRPLFMQNGNRRFSTSFDSEEISNFRRALPQFLAVSVKNILLFAYGMTLGFPTIVIPAIQGGEGRDQNDNIVLNRNEISWFSSINLICVPLGCIFSGLLTQPIGKRRAMQIVNLPMLASWLLFHFSTRTEHLYAALCLSGLGGGLMEAPVLTYVAEITEPKYRGTLSALGTTCVILGVFVQFILGSLTDWRTIAAVSSAFPVISIIALCFVPESPTWLIREQRYREAVKALMWLRGWVPEYKIEEEFNRLYDELIVKPAQEEAAENEGAKRSWLAKRLRLFRKRSFVVPFCLVALAFFTGHFSGKTPLQTYAVQIFHTLKAPINKYHATIILGVAELVATVISVFIIHLTGKRPLVFVSTIGVGLCMFGTATYAHYLNIVPGFAVNNVVVNASLIVPKESIISQENITRIFQTEEKALLLHAAELKVAQAIEGNEAFNETTTMTLNSLANDDGNILVTTMSTLMLAESSKNNSKRIRRATANQTNFGYAPLSLMDSSAENLTAFSLDYDSNVTNGAVANTSGYLLDLLDSEEDLENAAKETTTLINAETLPTSTTKASISTTTTMTVAPASTVKPTLEATAKRVVDDLLLPVPKQKKNNLVWIPLVLLLAGAFFAHLGIRVLPWVLIGEVFPAPVRSTASGLVSGLGYIFGFLANKLFLQMLSFLTLPGTFWFYSFVALMGALILYLTLPETEGRTLGQIEAHFSKKSDTNLLSKKWRRENDGTNNKNNNNDVINENNKTQLPLQNLDNLEIPMGPYTTQRIIKLQQSDLVGGSNADGGHVNPAYESSSNTTHL